MNCPECGQPFVLGTPHNPHCATARQARETRDRRLDILLEIFAEDIDLRMSRSTIEEKEPTP